MPVTKPVLVGAVLHDPKVSATWDLLRAYFDRAACPVDVVFYTNYELQVTALLRGDIDVAGNSSLAWLDAQRRSGGTCRAIAMRDSDRDRVAHLVASADAPLRRVEDLRGRTVAVGARDAPHATLIPLGMLMHHGLDPGRDVAVRRFDVLVGKHGDGAGGEREAFAALERGEADACAMLDLHWEAWTKDGTVSAERFRVLATTDPFDHGVFAARREFSTESERRWTQALFAMRHDDPEHRRAMDLAGLRAWLPGRTTGFGVLGEAIAMQGYWARGG
jgi:phosphonate transport system substrate-binding protein